MEAPTLVQNFFPCTSTPVNRSGNRYVLPAFKGSHWSIKFTLSKKHQQNLWLKFWRPVVSANSAGSSEQRETSQWWSVTKSAWMSQVPQDLWWMTGLWSLFPHAQSFWWHILRPTAGGAWFPEISFTSAWNALSHMFPPVCFCPVQSFYNILERRSWIWIAFLYLLISKFWNGRACVFLTKHVLREQFGKGWIWIVDLWWISPLYVLSETSVGWEALIVRFAAQLLNFNDTTMRNTIVLHAVTVDFYGPGRSPGSFWGKGRIKPLTVSGTRRFWRFFQRRLPGESFKTHYSSYILIWMPRLSLRFWD